ncbi:hypothetical protein [Paenibacillus sp. YN15]|uniref:hypothetical protein n=1 Tax=Paenibacillus sp. YN15 TaxID=1742774 RepID=UPI000DCEA4E8|nr:hypothetical protein [Paenibacillus sp. YN15]RAU91045.1 hypothetical protein DQG13_30000 [Paenibacillus sp. YN15]
MNTFILLLAFAYIIYILIIKPVVVNAKYGKDKTGITIPDDLDPAELLSLLQQKGFTYPELKNMRHNENGNVVIEGKYTSHELVIQNNKLFVKRGKKGGLGKETNCILEAVVIGHYLDKLFNPAAPVDAYKQFVRFKRDRKKPVFILILIFCIFLIPAIFVTGKEVAPQLQSNRVSTSYLTDYSSKVTIGEAFDNFFNDPKWKTYEQGIQKYVDFQGEILFNNEPATAVITFSILNDTIKVESIKVDNEELNPLEHDSFFQTVYEESTTKEGSKK